MAFDEGLAHRIREHLPDKSDVKERKMFGGLCFMVSGHMCCGIIENKLMARIGPDHYESCLKKKYVSEMDFTGKPMKGFLYVDPAGISDDSDLMDWISVCINFIETLPPKNK
jgi:TfoX/Sxy family transcriptional regulator of competence genes